MTILNVERTTLTEYDSTRVCDETRLKVHIFSVLNANLQRQILTCRLMHDATARADNQEIQSPRSSYFRQPYISENLSTHSLDRKKPPKNISQHFSILYFPARYRYEKYNGQRIGWEARSSAPIPRGNLPGTAENESMHTVSAVRVALAGEPIAPLAEAITPAREDVSLEEERGAAAASGIRVSEVDMNYWEAETDWNSRRGGSLQFSGRGPFLIKPFVRASFRLLGYSWIIYIEWAYYGVLHVNALGRGASGALFRFNRVFDQ